MSNNPYVGEIVHYVSYGTPGGEYKSQCRAAIVVGVPEVEQPEDAPALLDLCVLNPTGIFFNRCPQDEKTKSGGTWHWLTTGCESQE